MLGAHGLNHGVHSTTNVVGIEQLTYFFRQDMIAHIDIHFFSDHVQHIVAAGAIRLDDLVFVTLSPDEPALAPLYDSASLDGIEGFLASWPVGVNYRFLEVLGERGALLHSFKKFHFFTEKGFRNQVRTPTSTSISKEVL